MERSRHPENGSLSLRAAGLSLSGMVLSTDSRRLAGLAPRARLHQVLRDHPHPIERPR
jgi:hypothetical protein